MSERILQGRCIVEGYAEGEAIVTKDAISFMGTINPKTGVVIERKHEIEGQSLNGKILVFPCPKGPRAAHTCCTDLVKNGVGPLGIINREVESVVAIGAIVSDLPMVDGIDIDQIQTGRLHLSGCRSWYRPGGQKGLTPEGLQIKKSVATKHSFLKILVQKWRKICASRHFLLAVIRG